MRVGLALLDLRRFALAPARCPFCGPSLFVRLNEHDPGVRCLRCAASAVHLALGQAVLEYAPDLSSIAVCELSARGPLVDHLRRRAASVALSEYFADVAPGTVRAGVRCEDVQRLTYGDASFDLITHTEVLEHVPDDKLAFSELHRVLRPGGVMVFTVPLNGSDTTLERARVRGGVIEHQMPPIYHTDPLRSGEGILAFRDFGRDILSRLRVAGFADARIYIADAPVPWLKPREVVIAFKGSR